MTTRGHITQRSPGSWSIVMSPGTDPVTGKRRRIWRTIKGTKRQAQAELTKLLAENDRGISPVAGNLKLSDWLAEWLGTIVKRRNRQRTVQSYATICNTHIIPSLGNIPLRNLGPSHIDQLMTSVLDKGRTANTAHHVFTVLRKALNDAERRELIGRNPCRLTSPPHMEAFKVERPSTEAVKAILAKARLDEQFGSAIEFIGRTGIRRGEAVALRWKRIDFDSESVLIAESAQRIDGVGIVITPPKSAAGKRTLQLDPDTIGILRRWRARQDELALSLGQPHDDEGFVFARADGTALNPDHLTRAFKKHASEAGYPKLRLHDLRHHYAYCMIASNAHPKLVQERLGHTSAAFTMQVYGHGSEQMHRQAAERVAAILNV